MGTETSRGGGSAPVTVVYIDLLFLLNFVANYLLLLGTGRVAGSVLRRWRIALGAAAGAIYAVAVFLPGMGWLLLWPCKLASGVVMALIAYGGERGLLKVTLLFFAASAVLAGVVLGVELLGSATLTVEHGVFYTSADIRLLLLLFVLCYFILSVVFRRLGRHGGGELLQLEVVLEGGRATITALRDSGHSLTDPATNRPVVVADWRCLSGLLPPCIRADDPIGSVKRCQEAGVKGARLVPYRAVGVDCGMLLALRASSVAAEGRPLGSLLIALSPTPVDDGGSYQALIGGV